MTKKIIISSIIVAVIGCIIGLNLINTNISNKKDISVNFSEVSFSEDSLISAADIIVIGSIQKHVETKTELIKQNDPNLADINFTYSLYKLKKNEIISGDYPSEEIDIVFAGSNLPENIEMKNDYVFFLEKDMLGGNKYHLVSYAQGVFNTKDGKTFNNRTGMKFEKNNLIERAKKIKTK